MTELHQRNTKVIVGARKEEAQAYGSQRLLSSFDPFLAADEGRSEPQMGIRTVDIDRERLPKSPLGLVKTRHLQIRLPDMKVQGRHSGVSLFSSLEIFQRFVNRALGKQERSL